VLVPVEPELRSRPSLVPMGTEGSLAEPTSPLPLTRHPPAAETQEPTSRSADQSVVGPGPSLRKLPEVPSSERPVTAAVQETEPDNQWQLKLVCASWLGGSGNDRIESVAITPDHKIVLMLNSVDLTLPSGLEATLLGPAGKLEQVSPPPSPEPLTDPNNRDAMREYNAAMDKVRNWKHPSRRGMFFLRSALNDRPEKAAQVEQIEKEMEHATRMGEESRKALPDAKSGG
jgi:hypothetical protein